MTPASDLLLRPYASRDLAAVYDICLRTADAGADAAHLYADPWVLGHRYAGPYVALEPEFAFVLESRERVVGYILGVPDSARFAAESEAKWFSLLRPLYPLPAESDRSLDAQARRLIHAGCPAPDAAWLPQYPAHLHIDLLPQAQGRGLGRALDGSPVDRAAGGGRAGGASGRRARAIPGRTPFISTWASPSWKRWRAASGPWATTCAERLDWAIAACGQTRCASAQPLSRAASTRGPCPSLSHQSPHQPSRHSGSQPQASGKR